ncbi:MAG TPA: DUF6491 family protein [Allosphingosinicella sp.]|jgi:hypothetical protein
MKKLAILACAALSAAACTTNEQAEADRTAGEAQLSTALEGYEPAGPPVSCVNMRDLRGNRSAGETAIIFDGIGDRIWVNRPAGGCPDLSFNRALQVKATSSQLCRGDIATVFEPASGVTYGGCGLDDFQPYRRRPR